MSDLAPPADGRALVAVDLGAESCRVSLLQWNDGRPSLSLIYRLPNAPIRREDHLRWDLRAIERGMEHGLRLCAQRAPEGIGSVAVDGWAVDYVRLHPDGSAIDDPFCYRDERTLASQEVLHRKIEPGRLRELTGVQVQRINTLYQLYADSISGQAAALWLNLPEYLLHRWGGDPVSEQSNASHTQMLDLYKPQWSSEILRAADLGMDCMPRIVPTGTIVGTLRGELAKLDAFRSTVLIAPACHDTASAIAGIPATGGDWGYISSGTWSLVGTLLDQPCNDAAAAEDNFTNLRTVGGRICFHKNVNGMWLIKQCMESWEADGRHWTVEELVEAASQHRASGAFIDVDSPEMLLVGDMPQKINAQLERMGEAALDVHGGQAPAMADLIFRSLAARYGQTLQRIAVHARKPLKQIVIVGGGSRNAFLNRLTAEATGAELLSGSAESSTIGNLAVQLAVLGGYRDEVTGVYSEQVRQWAQVLQAAAAASSDASC